VRSIRTMWLILTRVTGSNKAVAVGAVSFHVDHFVTGRIAKFTYGSSGKILYDPSNSEHVKREKESYLNAAGEKRIRDHFYTMLSRVWHPPLLLILIHDLIALQGTKVLEDREVRESFIFVTKDASKRQIIQPVIKYTGTRRAPEWMDLEKGSFVFNEFVRGTQGKGRQVRDTMQCMGRYLYCSVPNRAGTLRRRILQAELRSNITCGPHRTQSTGCLDRLGIGKFSGNLISPALSDFRDVWIRGWRKGSKYGFQSSILQRLNLLFRSDAVVVYDNSSDWST
jgi:hypothetical protein